MVSKGDHHTNMKAILGFLIVALAAGILLLFVMNQETIMESNSFNTFMVLAVGAMGLFVGLLYLASQPHATKSKNSSSRKVTKAAPAKKTSKTKKKKTSRK